MSLAPIDVRDLAGQPGASRAVEVAGILEGLTSELAWVPDDDPVRADLLVEVVVEGILVSGRVRGAWGLRCARCLSEFEGAFDVEVHAMFVPEPDEDADDYPLELEDGLAVEQLIRDALGVEMPFAPLCRPACAGLCETCGGDRNLGECPGHEEADPRFAVLSQLQLPDD